MPADVLSARIAKKTNARCDKRFHRITYSAFSGANVQVWNVGEAGYARASKITHNTGNSSNHAAFAADERLSPVNADTVVTQRIGAVG